MATHHDRSTKTQTGATAPASCFHLGIFAVTGFVLCASAPVWAAAYFVDPVSGSDSNPGTSQTSPWRTVPGMSGATSWGSINSGSKVPAGSTIDIKAGSVFAGKRWVIDAT
jgi:hypothetical protein